MFAYKSQLFQKTAEFLLLLLGKVPKNSIWHAKIAQLVGEHMEEFALCIDQDMEDRDQKIEQLLVLSQDFFSSFFALLSLMKLQGELAEDVEINIQQEVKIFRQRQHVLMSKRKKIIILTASLGFGHNSAANALKNSLGELFGYDLDVRVIDILKAPGMLYETSVKYTPGVYRWIFESTDTDQSIEVINALAQPVLSSRIDQILKEENPDVIVSTYPFFGVMRWVEHKLQKNGKNIPLVAVVTDSITVHQMWIMEDVDFYIVPNTDTAEVLEQKGVEKESIKVLGFPVHPNFYLPYQAHEERQREGLAVEKFTFLVLVNTGAKAKDVDFLEDFEKTFNGDAQCMLILGKNEQLYKKLRKQNFGAHVKLYQWVADMPRLMHAADVVVAKAGGAITMECTAIKKPMIITKILPGQEEGNAETIEKYKVGTVLEEGSPEELLSAMKKYVYDTKFFEEQKKNYDALTLPNTTYESAKFIRSLL